MNHVAGDILVSVIIPTYNRAQIIIESINSVLNQTYQNFEILVIDDGSTDNTKDIVESINDIRIRYIYQENSGPSAARNNGIKNANGEWIAFLDSDDIWLPEKLGKQIEVINSSDDRLGIITCWSYNCYYNNNEFIKEKNISTAKNSMDFMLGMLLDKKVITGTNTFVIKKVCFSDSGYFDETIKCREDWDMWFRISLKYDFYCINECLALNNDTKTSLSKITDLESIKNGHLTFLNTVYNNINLPMEISRIKKSAYCKALWGVGWRALYEFKHRKFARECLFESLKYSYEKLFKPTFIITFILCFMPIYLINSYCKFRLILKKQMKGNK